MAVKLEPSQTLLLWRLIGLGGQFQSDIKPAIDAKDRKALEKAGLIDENNKRKKDGKGKELIFLEANDSGWAWANENLNAALPERSQSAGPILQAWLTQMQRHMRASGVSLSQIFSADESNGISTDGAVSTEVAEARIRAAYQKITGGKWGRRARLSELRLLLEDMSRDALDAALRDLQRARRLVLYPLDDPREIAPADEAAAIRMGGQPVHIVYIAS